MADLWTVNVSLETAGATRADFGTPMYVGFAPRFAELVRTYSTLAGMVTDGFLPTDAEYIAAAKHVAQSGQRTPTWKIGRRTSLPTIVAKLTPTAVNSKIYGITVNGTAVSYTSDSSATVLEILNGLKSAIDAVAPAAWVASTTYTEGQLVSNDTGKIYKCLVGGTSDASPATGPSGVGTAITDNTITWCCVGVVPTVALADTNTTLTLTAPVSGQCLFVEILDAPQYVGYSGLSLEYTHADPGLAANLTSIKTADPSWYGFTVLNAGTAEILAAAQWADSQTVIYAQDTSQTATLGSGTSDLMGLTKTANRERSIIFYRASQRDCYPAGIMARKFAFPAGKDGWAYTEVVGSAADNLSETAQTNVRGKNGNFVVDRHGDTCFFDGKTASGQWVDLVRGRDWLESEITLAMHDLQVRAANSLSQGRLPYTDSTVAAIANVVKGVLNTATKADHMFLVPGSVQITTTPVSQVSAATKATRLYPYVTWTAQMQGGINGGTISGSITY